MNFNEFLNDNNKINPDFSSVINRYQEIKNYSCGNDIYFVCFKPVEFDCISDVFSSDKPKLLNSFLLSNNDGNLYSNMFQCICAKNEDSCSVTAVDGTKYEKCFTDNYLRTTCVEYDKNRKVILSFRWGISGKYYQQWISHKPVFRTYVFRSCIIIVYNDNIEFLQLHELGFEKINISGFNVSLCNNANVIQVENENKFISIKDENQFYFYDIDTFRGSILTSDMFKNLEIKKIRIKYLDDTLYIYDDKSIVLMNLTDFRFIEKTRKSPDIFDIFPCKYGMIIFRKDNMRKISFICLNMREIELSLDRSLNYNYIYTVDSGFVSFEFNNNKGEYIHYLLYPKEYFDIFNFQSMTTDFVLKILNKKYIDLREKYEGDTADKILEQLDFAFCNTFNIDMKKTILYIHYVATTYIYGEGQIKKKLMNMLHNYYLTELFMNKNILFTYSEMIKMKSSFMSRLFYLEIVSDSGKISQLGLRCLGEDDFLETQFKAKQGVKNKMEFIYNIKNIFTK